MHMRKGRDQSRQAVVHQTSGTCHAATCGCAVASWCDECQQEYCRAHLLRDEERVLCICIGCWERMEREAEHLLPLPHEDDGRGKRLR
jgi:hypothetical protein